MKTRARWSKKKRKVPPGRHRGKVQKKVKREGSFPIVGIGASAGGLEAFERLLRHLPPDTGMAFLLVQHLDPTHESRLREILARDTSMPITEVKDGMRVAPNCVYVIPPNTNMSLRDRALHLDPRNDSTTQFAPVNFLFRSLANEQKNKAIGVILSGTASDGVVGMKAIKAEGGITFAQDEGSAKYFGMPQSSIVAGAVDFILSPEEIATHIARIEKHPYFKLPEVENANEATYPPKEEQARDQLFRLLEANFGVDFGGYKLSTIDRRIKRRMVLCSIDNLEDYLRYARKNRGELERLFQDMFIGVTRFFREPDTFTALQQEVFPHIGKQVPSDSPIRIWVPGCSTGEEVYSVAIALLEYLGARAGSTPIQIFGSDINEEAIRRARQGKYPDDIASDVGRARLERFFVKTSEGYQVSKAIRDLCTFAKHDLMRDAPFSRVDLISCRNVLIYLRSDSHRKLIPLFHYALKPSGFLHLGTAETIGGFSDLFNLVDRKHKIYAKQSAIVRLPVDFGHRYISKPGLAQGRETLAIPGANWGLQKDAADLLLLNEYTPASVLVNESMEILHFRGHTGPYLEPAPGVASLNLLKMAREGLLVSLRTAFNSARKKGGAAHLEGIRVYSDGREKTINLHVVPVKAPGIKDRTFLVVFEDVTHPAPLLLAKGTAGSGKGQGQKAREERVSQLKRELATTKTYLQSVTENQEASNEELRSLNEEIMSSNEELQSTTEELETANEELQSANEELTALNETLQTRNQELTQANNDILNLFMSMNVSVLLDRDLRIRRFTPTAQKVLHLASTDLGHPLTDIQLPVIIPDLKRHIVETMDSLKPMQADVQDQDGLWYALQIRPYITAENRMEGAVVALTDISALTTLTADLAATGEDLRREQNKRAGAEESARTGEERFQIVADSLPEQVADVAPDQRYRFTNAAFDRWFGLTAKEGYGRSIRELTDEETYGTIRPYIEKALLGQSASFEGYLSFEKAGRRYVHIDFVPRRDDGREVYGFYTILRDLTQLKEAEEKETFRRVVECAPDGVVLVNREGTIAMINSQTERMFGYSRRDLIGQHIEMLVPVRFHEAHVRHRTAYLQKPEARPMGLGLELNALRKDGSEFPVEISLSPMETADGIFVSGTIRDITERKQLADQRQWSAILEERSRMARDVHDTLAQGFTGIVLNLEAAEEAAIDLPEEVRNRIKRARDVARESLEEARRSILALSGPLSVGGDLANSIRGLADRYRSNTKTSVGFSVRGTSRHLDPAIEENLLRIAQQATDNALQHARGSSIRIELAFDEKQTQLTIMDDGQGFDVKKTGRQQGLTGMRERAKEIGGKFELKSQPGKGTRIAVKVPLLAAGRSKASP